MDPCPHWPDSANQSMEFLPHWSDGPHRAPVVLQHLANDANHALDFVIHVPFSL
jgi:hypothetical protein